MKTKLSGIASITETAEATIIHYGGKRKRETAEVIIKGYKSVDSSGLFPIFTFPNKKRIACGSSSIWDPDLAETQKQAAT